MIYVYVVTNINAPGLEEFKPGCVILFVRVFDLVEPSDTTAVMMLSD